MGDGGFTDIAGEINDRYFVHAVDSMVGRQTSPWGKPRSSVLLYTELFAFVTAVKK
jgi:hypothetical protein